MGNIILYWSLLVSQCVLSLGLFLASLRLFWGPRAVDRVLAIDAVYSVAMLLMVSFGMSSRSVIYFESALVLSLLSFVSTTAFIKFLMRGEVIE